MKTEKEIKQRLAKCRKERREHNESLKVIERNSIGYDITRGCRDITQGEIETLNWFLSK